MKLLTAKSFFRLFIGALLLAGVALGAHSFFKWKVQDYRKQLRAMGEKLTVAELTPAPVPAEQNGAASFQQAAAALASPGGVMRTNPPPAMRMVGPGKAMVGWAQLDIRDESDRTTNSWSDLEEDLSKNSEALNALQSLTNYPTLDFGVGYDPASYLASGDKSLECLSEEKQAAQRLVCAAQIELHRGDTAAAAADLRALLQIVKTTADQREVVSQLVRIAVAQIAVASTWEFLQAPRLTEEQLESVQSLWSQLEFRQAAENAITMERAMNQELLRNARQSGATYRATFGDPGPSDWLARANANCKRVAWRLWWSQLDELRALKGYQVLLDDARFVQTNYAFRSRIFQQRTELSELGILTRTNRDWWEIGLADPTLRNYFSQSVAATAGVLAVMERVETGRQMVLTALALKRYQLKHGNYAPELAALVPEYLPAIPRDPVDGKPLRYQLAGTTYLLYSIGEDGVDNGGDPVPASATAVVSNWMQGRDTVWPAPATEQEIQAYKNPLTFKGQSSPAHK